MAPPAQPEARIGNAAINQTSFRTNKLYVEINGADELPMDLLEQGRLARLGRDAAYSGSAAPPAFYGIVVI